MPTTELAVHREAAKITIAKNLVLARKACGMTQAELARSAEVSRATIAQMEGGDSDPRLSTMVALATALGTSPILLLLGEQELQAFISVSKSVPEELLSTEDVDKMQRLVSSGLRKQRFQAAQLGARAAQVAGLSVAGAAIGTVLLPGIGTAIGAAIGAFLGKNTSDSEED